MKLVIRQKYSPKTQSLKQDVLVSRNHGKVILQKTFNLLIFHENEIEGAVECCVNQVCQTEIEDEDVGDTSHLPVF